MKDYSVEPMASPGRRAAAYWFVDGLEEIVLGLLLLAVALMGILSRSLSQRGPHWLYALALGVGFLLYALKGRDLLDFLKSRVTYPRTGYAQPPEEQGPSAELLTLSLEPPGPPPKENVTSFGRRTGMAIFFFLVTPIDGSPRWLVPALMAALAATLYALNRNTEHPYRWWAAAALGLMGLPFLWVNAPPSVQRWLPLSLAGLWLAALGGLTLIGYLHENPYPRVVEGART